MELNDIVRGPVSPARVCGILGVVFLLFVPVASCGPIKIKGHEILRNADPTGERGQMFEPENEWLRTVYGGSIACSALGAAAPGLAWACTAAGGGGAFLLGFFLVRLNALLEEGEAEMELEEGTWFAFLCFVGILLQAGLLRKAQRTPPPG